jgi:c-di-GMP-binding flagellar brake protein YcgR
MHAQSPHHMASKPRPVAGSMNEFDGIERRGAVRVAIPFPATVRGMDQTGDRFTLDTVLDNLSSTGLYLRLARLVEPGAALFIVVRLTVVPAQQVAAASVAVRGVVLRAEPQAGETCGIAVGFTSHRFLYAVTT